MMTGDPTRDLSRILLELSQNLRRYTPKGEGLRFEEPPAFLVHIFSECSEIGVDQVETFSLGAISGKVAALEPAERVEWFLAICAALDRIGFGLPLIATDSEQDAPGQYERFLEAVPERFREEEERLQRYLVKRTILQRLQRHITAEAVLLSDLQLARLFLMVSSMGDPKHSRLFLLDMDGLMGWVRRYVEMNGVTVVLQHCLETCRRALEASSQGEAASRRLCYVEELIATAAVDLPPLGLVRGECWVERLIPLLEPEAPRARSWTTLAEHASTARAAKPSKSWQRAARERLEGLGEEQFARHITNVLEGVGRAGSRPILSDAMVSHGCEEPDMTLVDDRHADLLRGLVWHCGLVGPDQNPDLAPALSRTAERCFFKVRSHGARSSKVGRACLWSLEQIGGEVAAVQLTRLRYRVKHRPSLRLIGKAQQRVAEEAGITLVELEERSVPDFGLQAGGCRTEHLGECKAELELDGGKARLNWWNEKGKSVRSVPAAVRRDHKEEIKRLKETVKEIDAQLVAQTRRLERLLWDSRHWAVSEWRERYLDPPLLAGLVQRLIWQLSDGDRVETVMPVGGDLMTVSGDPAASISDRAEISLWHPLDSSVDLVEAWQRRLEEQRFVQPFRQAHREVYRITDAERVTETYSERFAGHFVLQRVFKALCEERQWRYEVEALWNREDGALPVLEFPTEKLVVTLEVAGAGAVSDWGTYVCLSTGRLRFEDTEGSSLSLASLAPRLFSEILRETGFLVEVSSVGNDLDWESRIYDDATREYWEEWHWGEKGLGLDRRVELLRRLVPMLAIGDRCSFEPPFLLVQGNLGRYRIHMGSGSVRTEEGASLCIQLRKDSSELFLPFEGDPRTAYVLGVAVTLAADDRIKDPSLRSQLEGL